MLPELAASIPSELTAPHPCRTRFLQATATALCDEGVLGAYNSDRSLADNIDEALAGWGQNCGHFDGLSVFRTEVSITDYSASSDPDGPLVTFLIVPSGNREEICIGPAMRSLWELNPGFPQVVTGLLSAATRGVATADMTLFHHVASSHYWGGEDDQESAVARLQDEAGTSFNAAEHLLPDDFHRDYPRWLFSYLERNRPRATLKSLLKGAPERWEPVTTTLEAIWRATRRDMDELRCPLYDLIADDGAELSPLGMVRMTQDDCADRILDDYEQNQGNNAGFCPGCGGYSALASNPLELRRAWRRLNRQLGLLRLADQLLQALGVISNT